jgi:hypothetical protein
MPQSTIVVSITLALALIGGAIVAIPFVSEAASPVALASDQAGGCKVAQVPLDPGYGVTRVGYGPDCAAAPIPVQP